jgi:Flp pilus assembly pilin Flp
MKDYMCALYSRATLSILSLRDEERGQGMVEYAVILVLVAMVCAAAFTGLAGKITSALGGITI